METKHLWAVVLVLCSNLGQTVAPLNLKKYFKLFKSYYGVFKFSFDLSSASLVGSVRLTYLYIFKLDWCH